MDVTKFVWLIENGIADVDEGRLDSVSPGQQLAEEAPDGLVGDVADDHVIAALQEREEYRTQGGDACREYGGRLAALHRRELPLQAELIVARIARVEQRPGVGPVECRRIFGQAVGVGHDDRRADGARRRVDDVPGMDRLAVERQARRVLLVGPLPNVTGFHVHTSCRKILRYRG